MQSTGNTTNDNSPGSPNISTLAERIKAKTEQDRQEIETLTKQQFNDLQQSLSESSKNALSTTEAAILAQLSTLEKSMATRCQTLSRTFGIRCLQALLLSFALVLGLTLGGWGLMHWETSRILALHQEAEQLQTDIAALEKTAAQLEAKTWSLELSDSEKGRFIILPAKVTPKTGWTFGNRQAIKLE